MQQSGEDWQRNKRSFKEKERDVVELPCPSSLFEPSSSSSANTTASSSICSDSSSSSNSSHARSSSSRGAAVHASLDTKGGVVLRFHQKACTVNEQVEDSSGRYIWDASLIFARYLLKNYARTQAEGGGMVGKRVIELGAGCGVCGMACALLGGEVVLSDIGTNCELLETNVQENKRVVEGRGTVCVREHFWGSDASALQPPFDFVIGSDLVFDMELFEPLVKSMVALGDSDTVYLMCLEVRWKDVTRFFFEEAEKYFDVQEVPRKSFDSVYRKDNVNVYVLRQKQSME